MSRKFITPSPTAVIGWPTTHGPSLTCINCAAWGPSACKTSITLAPPVCTQ
ncbi:MAG: six-cysteine ranthipeptide SCIFF [Chloroflexi bacterium]|nr:six-cysteine ranthipeptide SCIFF [Chloroflexota bacterium]